MKKFELKQLSFNFFKAIKYIYPATILVIVIILIFFIRFLYYNVYQTIIQAELITDLQKEISEETLKRDKFDRIIENITTKTTSTELNFDELKNPFAPLPE